MLNEAKCLENKKDNKTLIDDCQCSSCNDGFYLSKRQCLQCNSKCRTCRDKDEKCLSCEEKNYLTEEKTCKNYAENF